MAKQVARQLGYLYVDSGALYRGVTWKALKDGIPTNDASRVRQMLPAFPMEFSREDGAVKYRIEGVDPGIEIRTEAVNSHVSQIAATPEVRDQVNAWLRDMTKLGDLVVEGRDIGTGVFPNADHKFYLDASPEERARRRYREMGQQEKGLDEARVGESLKKRDTIDSTRSKDPLKVAADAVRIDSTGLEAEDVVRFVLERVRVKR